jgi:uncharacterized membrane protein YhaH (DUF805 family)
MADYWLTLVFYLICGVFLAYAWDFFDNLDRGNKRTYFVVGIFIIAWLPVLLTAILLLTYGFAVIKMRGIFRRFLDWLSVQCKAVSISLGKDLAEEAEHEREWLHG